jgi:predicted ester cyclase
VVADDEIAFAYTLTGTHEGQFNGIAPTGKRVEESVVYTMKDLFSG